MEKDRSEQKEIGLYIHIPFCRSKCHYCDFNSFAGKEHLIPSYFDALEKEALHYASELEGYRVKTVFIGGGTPSLVEARHIIELMDELKQAFAVDKEAEISIEANPGTLDREKLTAYRAAGINRLSIGLQAWQDNLLKSLDRIHRAGDFAENFETALKVGFKNINVDLMFGLPGQTLDDWVETVLRTVEAGAPHISCYSLKIEEGTVFGERLASGELTPVDEDLDRKMYASAIGILRNHGYRHYEISNFAKPGYECRHNLIYWKAGEYLGLGAGAHSYIKGKRYNNTSGVEEYIKAVLSGKMPVENVERIGGKESMAEFMILGLRLIDGVSFDEFRLRYGKDMMDVFGNQIHGLVKRKLLEMSEGGIKLSSWGLDLANQVFMEFV